MRRRGMSKTKRAERNEATEDQRGNPTPAGKSIEGLAWSAELAAEREDQICDLYCPKDLPLDMPGMPWGSYRNWLIKCVVSEVLMRRGHDSFPHLDRYMSNGDFFDLLVVLNDYSPCDVFATTERDDLFYALPLSLLEDELVAELAGDAMLCMDMGESPEDTHHFLVDEDEWTEFRVSVRVALESK